MSTTGHTGPVPPGPPLPAYAEIANLEHELALLRERYASHKRNAQRMAQMLTYGYWLTLGTVVAGFVYALAIGNGDAAAKVFLIMMLMGVMGLAYRFFNDDADGPPNGLYNELGSPFANQDEFLSHAIAVREQRLNELKRDPDYDTR